MKNNRWHDQKIDTNLFFQLQDLTTVLSQVDDFKFEFAYGSFIDMKDRRITGSTIWDATQSDIQKHGYKTDVYLRAIGTLNHSQLHAFNHFWTDIDGANLNKFSTQLINLLEDLRLEEIIKHDRPGSTADFSVRRAYLKRFFTSQLTMNITRGLALDELFCMIYLLLQSDGPEQEFSDAHKEQRNALDIIKSDLYESFEATTTQAIAHVASKIIRKLSDAYADMTNVYFTFPIFKLEETYRHNTLFDELTRTDDVVNKDSEELDEDHNEYIDKTFSTWHRENENKERQQTFLQMDLEVGTKTNLKGGEARETESGDQAFASAQGMAKKSKQNDYSKRETLEKQTSKQDGTKDTTPYGSENMNAFAIFKDAKTPTQKEQLTYEAYVFDIDAYKRKLARTIEKVLEHKKVSSRGQLHYGRLSKNLLPIVTDKNPRLFYRQDESSPEFDAIFTLMIDCSASMHQKMAETKRGIVLFHEVLNQLKIPHQIIGFWEEATTMNEREQPNYFHVIHSFTDSFYENNGAKIMQLEPKEDNRDGFSIRVITEQMMERREKHKFLLVFSDGEPAAANYDENGIVDTHLAVTEARKKGIDVIGMFLSDGQIDEQEDETMKNIYGRERLMIPDVSELPERFIPVLKKLLLRTL